MENGEFAPMESDPKSLPLSASHNLLWFGLTHQQKEGINLMVSRALIEYDERLMRPRHESNSAKMDAIINEQHAHGIQLVKLESRNEHEDKHEDRSDRSRALLVASIFQTLALIVAIIALLLKR